MGSSSKDTLSVQGHAWLGRCPSGKQTLLSAEADRLAGLLLDEGPLATRAPRDAVGATGKRFDQVLTERDARAAARFMDTMVEAKPAALCRAFGWSRERAATALGS